MADPEDPVITEGGLKQKWKKMRKREREDRDGHGKGGETGKKGKNQLRPLQNGKRETPILESSSQRFS